MRRTISPGSVALTYALGLLWTVMLFAAVVLLLAPLSATYREVGIDEPLVAVACTTGLAVALATAVAGGLWLVIRRRRLLTWRPWTVAEPSSVAADTHRALRTRPSRRRRAPVCSGSSSGQPPDILLTPGRPEWIYLLAGGPRADGGLPYTFMSPSRAALVRSRARRVSRHTD